MQNQEYKELQYCKNCDKDTPHIEKSAFNSDGDEQNFFECEECGSYSHEL